MLLIEGQPVCAFSEVGTSQRQASEGPGQAVSGSPSQLHPLGRVKDFTLIEAPQRNKDRGWEFSSNDHHQKTRLRFKKIT